MENLEEVRKKLRGIKIKRSKEILMPGEVENNVGIADRKMERIGGEEAGNGDGIIHKDSGLALDAIQDKALPQNLKQSAATISHLVNILLQDMAINPLKKFNGLSMYQQSLVVRSLIGSLSNAIASDRLLAGHTPPGDMDPNDMDTLQSSYDNILARRGTIEERFK